MVKRQDLIGDLRKFNEDLDKHFNLKGIDIANSFERRSNKDSSRGFSKGISSRVDEENDMVLLTEYMSDIREEISMMRKNFSMDLENVLDDLFREERGLVTDSIHKAYSNSIVQIKSVIDNSVAGIVDEVIKLKEDLIKEKSMTAKLNDELKVSIEKVNENMNKFDKFEEFFSKLDKFEALADKLDSIDSSFSDLKNDISKLKNFSASDVGVNNKFDFKSVNEKKFVPESYEKGEGVSWVDVNSPIVSKDEGDSSSEDSFKDDNVVNPSLKNSVVDNNLNGSLNGNNYVSSVKSDVGEDVSQKDFNLEGIDKYSSFHSKVDKISKESERKSNIYASEKGNDLGNEESEILNPQNLSMSSRRLLDIHSKLDQLK